jgi:tripartite-type tricarboxylate transporter receptor subunit TctC
MIDRRSWLIGSAAAAFAPALAPGGALAQAWPNRPVRLIVPFNAGGSTDFVGRLVADRLARTWGQQVVIENRGGAGTNIGAEVVARSDPDGYTIFMATSSTAVNRSLYRSLSYDPVADFAPVAQLSSFSLFMFVSNVLPAKSIKEFIAHAAASKDKLTLASPGIGTTPHLAGELFKRMAGVEMTHVPYRGAAAAINDLIPGRVHVYFGSGALLGNARSGQIRALAVTGAKREPTAPEIPTIAEAGLPDYEVSSWHAFFVPVRTPAEIVRKLNVDTLAALADPEVKDKLEQGGYIVIGSSPERLAALLKSEIDKWAVVVGEAGIKID